MLLCMNIPSYDLIVYLKLASNNCFRNLIVVLFACRKVMKNKLSVDINKELTFNIELYVLSSIQALIQLLPFFIPVLVDIQAL